MTPASHVQYITFKSGKPAVSCAEEFSYVFVVFVHSGGQEFVQP